MFEFLQIMLAVYLTIGVIWTLMIFGSMLTQTGSYRANWRGQRVTGFKKFLVTLVLVIYTTLLWPMSVGQSLLS